MPTIVQSPPTWPNVKLGECVNLLTGFPFKSADYTEDESDVRLLRGDNVAQGYLRWDGVKRWPVGHAKEYARFELSPGDVVLAMDRPWIEAGLKYAWVALSDLPALLVQRVARLRGTNALCTEYLRYVIGCADFTDYVKSITTGTAVPHISATDIAEYEFLLPPLAVQHKIVDILSVWDRAIGLTTQLIAVKQARKRGLMELLLTGYVRFTAFQRQWSSATFGQIFSTKNSRNTGSRIRNPITVGKYAIRPQSEHFNRVVASDNLENYNIIEEGDFVYDPMSAYYGAIGRYELAEPGIVSPVYRVLRINPDYDSDFMKYLIKSHRIAYQLSANSSQGNRHGKRRTIQEEAFDSISFAIPTVDEQRAIAQVLNACDRELALLERKLTLLKQQKEGLMQQLLTGKLRVAV